MVHPFGCTIGMILLFSYFRSFASFLLAFAGLLEAEPAEGCDTGADERGEDEDPELFQRKASPDYLQDIQASYMNYLSHITNIPVVVVDTHELDFVKNPSDYEYLKSLLEKDYPKGMSIVIPGEEQESLKSWELV